MKTLSLKRLCSFILPVFFLTLSAHFPQVVAESPSTYGHQFGLFVDERNQDLSVPKFKGMQVLESYFSGTPLKPSYDDQKAFMSQRDFLLWFEKLNATAEKKEVTLSDDELYPILWLRARHNNWLPDSHLTYASMREFFYRYSVSQKHGGVPYHEGLVLSPEEINPDQFSSLSKVREVQKQLEQDLMSLKRVVKPTLAQTSLRASLESYQTAFTQVQSVLLEREKPINKIPNLPQEIRDKIIDNHLNQILGSISYDYSDNNSNRIHNMTTGLAQISGRLYQPDETINFTQELSRNGWDRYKYGWVILGGQESWEFGGGLCGSATMTFTPSWRAGMEIISRAPHSIYYKNLYPKESFGLDATIYRGGKNLIMKNTTGSPILYYTQNDTQNKKITTWLIGNSPYADIQIEGPVKTGKSTYKTVRRMTRLDGTVVEDEIISKYNGIR